MSYSILDECKFQQKTYGYVYNSRVTLSSGSLRTLPVEIILPDSTPARNPVNIEIFMTSEGNSTISDSVIITLEARQDYRWDIVLHSSLGNVEGGTFEISLRLLHCRNKCNKYWKPGR